MPFLPPVLPLTRRLLLTAAVLPLGTRSARADNDRWRELAAQIFDGRSLDDGAALLAVDAPARAEDAAVVPVEIRVLARHIHRISLVIDGNPAPLGAVFTVGPRTGLQSISTRVRVDSYTNVHAVAERDDGTLGVVSRFVKASGGCSAPASKHIAGDIPLGTMRFRQFASAPNVREAQLMIRHPNHSGMQMDQLTRLYVPAQFVNTVRLWQGEELLIAIESGISISENPEYRFVFGAAGNGTYRAEATDTEGHVFRGAWSAVS